MTAEQRPQEAGFRAKRSRQRGSMCCALSEDVLAVVKRQTARKPRRGVGKGQNGGRQVYMDRRLSLAGQ